MKLKQKLKQFAGHTDIHVESENNWYRGNKDQLMQIINEEDMETEVVSSYLVGREGLTFMELEKIPGHSRILANVYLPTEDGTTEVDLIFINQSGIYAVESKNYTGWIFGDYRKKVWTSVIYKSKHKFFNPIWQSNKHSKYIELSLAQTGIHSIVVFSNRCEFKKTNFGNNIVIHRRDLKRQLKKMVDLVFTENEVDDMYYSLKKYSNQSESVEQEHIDDIKKE